MEKELRLKCQYRGGFKGVGPQKSPHKALSVLDLDLSGYQLQVPRWFRSPFVLRGGWENVNVLVSQISEMNFRFVIATGDFGSGVLVVPVRSSVAHINWLLEHLMGRHPGGEEAEAARAEGIAQRSSLHYLLDLSPSGFERAVAEILATNGYLNVEILGGAGDLGADLRCADSYGQSVVVQCKQYAVGRKVTSQEMQLFIGMGRLEHRADRLLYVTTAEYTKAAMALAAKHGVELFDGQRLVGLGRGTGESP